jgi:hypothetical protein
METVGTRIGGVKAQNGALGGSVDKRSQIRITLTRNMIRLHIRVKSRIRIRIRVKEGDGSGSTFKLSG